MYTRIFSALNLPLDGQILGISGLKYFKGSRHYKPPVKVFADTAVFTEANYPEIKINSLPYDNDTFDAVIADQVIEHVEGDVQKAIDEIYRVLKKGGVAIITTVFIYPVHWGPKDLWRFSPDGLEYLCRNYSTIIQREGWGNRLAHLLCLISNNVYDWEIPNRKFSFKHWLATHSNKRYPSAVWIIARK